MKTHTRKTWATAIAILATGTFFSACSQPPTQDQSLDESWEENVKTAVVEVNGQTFSLNYEIINDLAMVEEDMVIGKVPKILAATAVPIAARWPNHTVPYRLDPSLEFDKQLSIRHALMHWATSTSMTFVERTNETDYVEFVSKDGCWSYVGRQGGRQEISIGNGCTATSVVHEIGHAIGLFHEQSRHDRDEHVIIHWDNIQQSKKHNFQKYPALEGMDVGPYDFGSVMHYSSLNTFAIDQTKPTITRRDNGGLISRSPDGLSCNDIVAVKNTYGISPATCGNCEARCCDDLVMHTEQADAQLCEFVAGFACTHFGGGPSRVEHQNQVIWEDASCPLNTCTVTCCDGATVNTDTPQFDTNACHFFGDVKCKEGGHGRVRSSQITGQARVDSPAGMCGNCEALCCNGTIVGGNWSKDSDCIVMNGLQCDKYGGGPALIAYNGQEVWNKGAAQCPTMQSCTATCNDGTAYQNEFFDKNMCVFFAVSYCNNGHNGGSSVSFGGTKAWP